MAATEKSGLDFKGGVGMHIKTERLLPLEALQVSLLRHIYLVSG